MYLQRLNNDSTRSTTTIANTSGTNLPTLLLKHIDQRRNDTRTRASQRMTNSNRTTVDVDLLHINIQQLDVGKRNNRESLVDLKEVNLLLGHTGVLEGLGKGKRGGGGELDGSVLSITPAENLSEGGEVELLELRSRDKDNSRGTVVDGGGVRSGDGAAVGDEDGLDALKLLDVELYISSVPFYHPKEQDIHTFETSSSASIVFMGLPRPPETSIGAISSLNAPAATAACAFW